MNNLAKKLFIETLGCPKNFNDSEAIAGIWEKSGGEVTDDLAQAEVIIINTCGFINDAKTESIESIFNMVRFKSDSKNIVDREPIIIVSGCLSERYGAELSEEIPEVDAFLGVNDYENLPQIVSAIARKDCQQRVYHSPAPDKFAEFSARKIADNPYTATLRIAEGCDNRCAYCVIPLIRGGYRSRPMESIIEEAEMLSRAGTVEIVLIAQDVTEYGRDIYGKLMLPKLLEKLCQVDGIKWIRLMYCYEDKITDELIDVMAREEKICNYIDIPLQHISDNVLGAMRRRSTSDSIRKTLNALRSAMPDIHIRTTFITGFPGETEDDYRSLEDFTEEFRFERLGVFAYSREEGTPADEMTGHIEQEIKEERAQWIMRRQVNISREVNESKIGKVLEVLVEGIDEDKETACGREITYIGRSRYDAPEIDCNVIFKDLRGEEVLRPGTLVNVLIEDAFDYDLVGIIGRK